ncbi:hypothetical protein KQ51_00306 [Candidatus Izimaplasma bacterium HR1]|jgi:hypothetical protein|uniref:hypothetical protein n=1 Tax=Candidatus Izimoplasma sp. HR1 TaxID=1541959 RepID=UPI0004F84E94|nr:hypothetical protein KQ51_00306 [Candidatus Izimaplasma bacterium HR1]
MRQDTSKYQYNQLETYKELLELKHIKTKTLIVNIINVIFGIIVVYFLYKLDLETNKIMSVMFMFVMLVGMNILLYSFEKDLYNNLKFAMYLNTLGEYIIAITLILMFRTPSIFTALFLAYAITAIYQDYKVMITSNSALFLSGFLLAIGYSEIFAIPGITVIQNIFIVVFLFIFVLLLTLSSYILIKRKSFFYNHLAQSKESEIRNLDLQSEVALMNEHTKIDASKYYDSLNEFSKHLSKKIGIDNVFARKIQLLKDLEFHTVLEMVEKYPDYTTEEINQLRMMELAVNDKMRNLGLKASITQDIKVTRKEIFSESQFKSFKHYSDDRYVKIISTVVFYCLLKIDKPYLKKLSEEQIRDYFFNSEYFYLIDRDIIEIYLKNDEVFDTIVNDILKGSWNYEKTS